MRKRESLLTTRGRARHRATFLCNGDDSEDAYHKWLSDRLEAIHAEWVPTGKVDVPPSKATIRDVLRTGVLGGKSLVHLCMVFQVPEAYWYLDDESMIYEAARVTDPVSLVVTKREAAEWLAKHSADNAA